MLRPGFEPGSSRDDEDAEPLDDYNWTITVLYDKLKS